MYFMGKIEKWSKKASDQDYRLPDINTVHLYIWVVVNSVHFATRKSHLFRTLLVRSFILVLCLLQHDCKLKGGFQKRAAVHYPLNDFKIHLCRQTLPWAWLQMDLLISYCKMRLDSSEVLPRLWIYYGRSRAMSRTHILSKTNPVVCKRVNFAHDFLM